MQLIRDKVCRFAIASLAIAVGMVLSISLPAEADTVTRKGPAIAAAEQPAPAVAAPSTWTGLYLGGHAGYGWADWDGTIATTAGCGGTCPSAGYSDHTRELAAKGWLGGGQIGYNWQSGALVLGLEADLTWADMDGDGRFPTEHKPRFWDKSFALSLDYFGTARVRLGYAAGSVMPFMTGGLAWARTSGDLAVAQTWGPTGKVEGVSYASVREHHLGWTVGGGLEWKLSPSMSVKAEYLYVDLGGEDYRFSGTTFTGAPFDTDSFPADLTLHVARIGLNYRFGGN
jgi:outer membrane immunogenic protein